MILAERVNSLNFSYGYASLGEIVMYFDQQIFGGKAKRHLSIFYHKLKKIYAIF